MENRVGQLTNENYPNKNAEEFLQIDKIKIIISFLLNYLI